MALANASNLAPRAISDLAWLRLTELFPLNYVTRASGPRGFQYPYPTTDATGTISTYNEAASQASATAHDPTIALQDKSLLTYRAEVTVSNELLSDSRVLAFIADRLSAQIAEQVGTDIITTVRTRLESASRFTESHHFDIGTIGLTGASKIEDHSGFACWSNLSNIYRSRACWVLSPSAARNWGTQEGKAALVTLGIRQEDFRYGKNIGSGGFSGGSAAQPWSPAGEYGGAGAGGGGAGGGPGNGGPELEAAKIDLQTRSALVTSSPTTDTYHTAYLGCPVHTSTGMADVHNSADDAWMMLCDLTAYLHFDQPLTVLLDTESKIEKNQSVIRAAYRANGAFMEPTAGWALVSPSA